MARFKIEKSKTADKLVKLVEETLAGINEEMEHGHYGTPDAPPFDYDEEELGDYYDNHEKIVDKVVGLRIKLEKFIEDYKKAK